MKHEFTPSRLRRLAAMLLASVLLLGLFSGCKQTDPADTQASGTSPASSGTDVAANGAITENTGKLNEVSAYTVDELNADDSRLDTVIASAGDRDLTNRQFQLFYYMQYFGFMGQYGAYASYFGLDTTKPLSEQPSIEEDMTWEQYFVSAGLDQFHQFAAAYAKAVESGHKLSDEENEQLESVFSGLADEAEQYGFESADAYIQASFGPGVTQKDYEDYLRLYFLAMSYENKIYNDITWTEDDLRAYALAHPDEYDTEELETPNIMVRHILIQPETAPAASEEDGEDASAETVSEEEAKTAAKEKAEALLAEYEEDPTEDHFSKLANENSTDPGSNTNGGLYDDVYPGQMVPAFNDWCFDPARKSGDTGIVETDYGYHVMYFVGRTDHYQWKIQAEEEYPNSVMSTTIQEFMDAMPMYVNYPAIVIGPMPQDAAAAEEAEAVESSEAEG